MSSEPIDLAALAAQARAGHETRVVDEATGAEKGVKLFRYDLVPTRPLAEVALHYGLGAVKYAERNWEAGYPYSRSYSALQRHAQAWWGGEDLDPEFGTSHLAAVVWHALAEMQFLEDHPDLDDRPARPANPSRHPSAGQRR